ncbi:hypothetical protein FSP39_012604 [Pinctada imbricata]|uniref:non-specific serine/threonine protein kinase n=1 Tax=Pinctada imbricata TaxID=66713 RepID=A0AA88Y8Z2_PINIB|nr:hypothetical protein FSP39_012604 [Pinctada imbricata]
MDAAPPGKTADLATLANLDDKVLLNELKIRYSNNNIYTYVGDILIAINPFKDVGIYDAEYGQKYFLENKSSNPPHIFAIADSTYQCMVGYGGRIPTNQCVLISGESGAGKTESTKLIIKQLIDLCHGNTQLEQQILQVNPLLEAFGNAQTAMNDNSSRFGKYIQLVFQEGQVMGAKISEYLLEKSRVVRQNKEEESFHIFYYMFAGLNKENLQKYHLYSAEKHRYLTNGASCLRREPKALKKRYEDLLNAMDLVGFTDEEQYDMFNMIAAVLHMGNVTFSDDDNDAAYVEDDNGAVKYAATLLGIGSEELIGTLTSMVTYTRGEQVKRNYTSQQSEDARDAMSKTVYGRLFGWIVNKVNQLLAPRILEGSQSEQREIGILDIFGFEHFEKNSFEQACINLANEQLQFFFNQHVFKLEQEEYVREGIDWKEIKFVDNQPLLNLFLNKPIGILSLLDEESLFPRGTDISFVEKLNIHFKGNTYYGKSAQTTAKFTISHYAGKVTYDSGGWLEKNRDTLPPGLMEMLQHSTNALVKLIFRAQVTRTGSLALQARKSTSRRTRRSKKPAVGLEDGRKRKQTVGGQFKNSLNILMERMTSSDPVFVRCLKPNHVKAPGKFDEKYIKDQLLYTGMLETTKIRREGFAVRPSFPEFVEKYKIIVCQSSLPGTKENCVKILKASKIQGWQVGKTKVFLKYYHIEQLADIFQKMGVSAIKIQKVIRGFLGRCKYRKRREVARKEAERVRHLLSDIKDKAVHLGNELLIAKENDKKIPESFFGKGDDYGLPPVPDYPGSFTPQLTVRSYEQPAQPKSREMGIQAQTESGSESEFSDDEFKPISSNKFGKPGTKGATIRWFKETQTAQVYDPVNVEGNFIAEWFHGVISRRESETLLKTKPKGMYLIRVSESRFGYTLSFSGGDRTRHYMIDQLPNKKYIVIGEPKVHRTLKDLVDYHKKEKISNWDGLLSEPCGQETGNCDYQELLGDDFYFTLEQKERMASKAGRPLPNRPRESNPPPLPNRNYSVASTVTRPDNTVVGRPLPERPGQGVYNRLLHNQALMDEIQLATTNVRRAIVIIPGVQGNNFWSIRLFGKRILKTGRLVASSRALSNPVPTYNCDVVITFPPETETSTLMWLLDRLRARTPQIIVHVHHHSNTKGSVFHLTSTYGGLLQGAEDLGITKPLKEEYGGGMKEFTVEDQDCFLGVEEEESFFTSQERQTIIHHMLSNLRAYKGELFGKVEFLEGQAIVPTLESKGVISQVFPLHSKEDLNTLRKEWMQTFFKHQPLDKIRDYFGEKIAMYFAYLGHYTLALMLPTFLGAVIWFSSGCCEMIDDQLFLGFALFNAFWATLYLEHWKRHSSELAYKWGTLDTKDELIKDPRPMFSGDLVESPVTGRQVPYYPAWKRNLFRYFVTCPVICLCLFFTFVVMLLIFELQEWINGEVKKENLYSITTIFPKVLLAICIGILDDIYKRIAYWLNDKENYRMEETYENHLIVKVALFQFVNSFLSLFYIAFYLQDMDRLRDQLAAILITRQVIGNIKEAFYPYLYWKVNLCRVSYDMVKELSSPSADVTEKPIEGTTEKTEEGTTDGQTEKEGVKNAGKKTLSFTQAEVEGAMKKYEDTFEDHLEMFIQFGYVTLFSSAFPLAALCALLNNVVEIRSDAFKLCMNHQRPFGKRTESIGTWQDALELMGVIAVVVNCALIGVFGQIQRMFPMATTAVVICIIVSFEHIILALKFLIAYAIPDVPESVATQKARLEFLRREAFKSPKCSLLCQPLHSEIREKIIMRQKARAEAASLSPDGRKSAIPVSIATQNVPKPPPRQIDNNNPRSNNPFFKELVNSCNPPIVKQTESKSSSISSTYHSSCFHQVGNPNEKSRHFLSSSFPPRWSSSSHSQTSNTVTFSKPSNQQNVPLQNQTNSNMSESVSKSPVQVSQSQTDKSSALPIPISQSDSRYIEVKGNHVSSDLRQRSRTDSDRGPTSL